MSPTVAAFVFAFLTFIPSSEAKGGGRGGGGGGGIGGGDAISSLSTGAIIGIAVGVAVVLIISVVAYFVWKRMKARRTNEEPKDVTPIDEEKAVSSTSPPRSVTSADAGKEVDFVAVKYDSPSGPPPSSMVDAPHVHNNATSMATPNPATLAVTKAAS